MGFLLLQYEYQRANNQYNLCERTGIRLNDQVTKYTKRVEKMQTLFQKAESRLENDYKARENTINSAISSAAASGQASPQAFLDALGSIRVGNVNISSMITVPSVNSSDPTSVQAAITALASQIRNLVQVMIAECKEADLDNLHAQQDAQLEPIAEKESDYEAQKTSNEALTTLWEQRRDKAQERLSKDIEHGVANYGLGR